MENGSRAKKQKEEMGEGQTDSTSVGHDSLDLKKKHSGCALFRLMLFVLFLARYEKAGVCVEINDIFVPAASQSVQTIPLYNVLNPP